MRLSIIWLKEVLFSNTPSQFPAICIQGLTCGFAEFSQINCLLEYFKVLRAPFQFFFVNINKCKDNEIKSSTQTWGFFLAKSSAHHFSIRFVIMYTDNLKESVCSSCFFFLIFFFLSGTIRRCDRKETPSRKAEMQGLQMVLGERVPRASCTRGQTRLLWNGM